MIELMMKICHLNFGTFEKEEFKKFLRMGGIFALIVGAYWTMRPLKDAIFIQLVDKMHLPFAKTVSVFALLPLVIFYTKLLENNSREKMFVILPSFYGIIVLFFSLLMLSIQSSARDIANESHTLYILIHIIGYTWYLFVESFGSLVIALFWAFATDITEPASAKRGFPLVVAIGQIGGIILPYGIGGLPYRLGLKTDAISISIVGILILSIAPLIGHFIKITPKSLLTTFKGNNDTKLDNKPEPGFLEGLKILLSHRYLISIFAVNFIYEFIITIFDFNFKITASTKYTGVALSNYLSIYGSSVNTMSLLCLLLGISNITRYLGLRMALIFMPIILGIALFSFMTVDSLTFLFVLMVGSKSINYALNGPALKQLYIPTTSDVRFKAQAWIETFGSRASKEAGSLFNMLLKPLQSSFGSVAGKSYYLAFSGILGFPLIILWLITALYLGNTYLKALDDKKVIC